MKRMFAIIGLACMAALSFVASVAESAVNFAFNLIPNLASAKPMFVLDNGHPRSPLASLRAGMA